MSLINTSTILNSVTLPSKPCKYLVDASSNDIVLTLPVVTTDGVEINISRVDISTKKVSITGTYDGKDIFLISKTSVVIVSKNNKWYYNNNGYYTAKNQTLYVVSTADNKLADGSEKYPYPSLSLALAAINDASPTKRYQIIICCDELIESKSVLFKPNIDIVGNSIFTTKLNMQFILDTGWADSVGITNASSISNCFITGASNTFDFNAVKSLTGHIHFTNTIFANSVSFIGYTSNNKYTFNLVEFLNGYSITGGTLEQRSICVRGGSIQLISSNNVSLLANISGNSTADVSVTGTKAVINLYNFPIKGTLTIASGNTINATLDSIPVGLTNNGKLNYLNPGQSTTATNTVYTVANGANWVPPYPTNVTSALDQLALRTQSQSVAGGITYNGTNIINGWPATVKDVKAALDDLALRTYNQSTATGISYGTGNVKTVLDTLGNNNNYVWDVNIGDNPWGNPNPQTLTEAISRLAKAANNLNNIVLQTGIVL
jgi:hypothetical protein